MKIWVGLFAIASVGFLSIGSSAQASTTCSGVQVSITGLASEHDTTTASTGCSVSVPVVTETFAPLPSAGGSTTLTANSVRADLQAANGGAVGTKGTVTDTNVFVNLPTFFSFGNTVTVSGIHYDLTTATLAARDIASVNFSNPAFVDLAHAIFTINTTVTNFYSLDLFNNKTLTSATAARAAGVQIVDNNPIGLDFTYNCSPPSSACGNASVALGDTITLKGFSTSPFNGLEFNLSLSLDTLLATNTEPGSGTTLTANDPITFVLLDANGQIIPGVTFVTDDGFDFGGSEAATPIPATLPLFASGIGGLGLLGWRRKRKARVEA